MGSPPREPTLEELDEPVATKATAPREPTFEELDEPVAQQAALSEEPILEEPEAQQAGRPREPTLEELDEPTGPPPGAEVVKLGKHGLWEPPGAIVGKWAKHVGLPLPPVQTFKPHEEVPVRKGVTEILRATGTLETGVSPAAKYLLDEEVAAIERKREEVQARAHSSSLSNLKLPQRWFMGVPKRSVAASSCWTLRLRRVVFRRQCFAWAQRVEWWSQRSTKTLAAQSTGT